jgi:hypothetical protein
MSLLEQQGVHVSRIISHCRENSVRTIDVEEDAETDYTQFCATAAAKAPFMKCISYYNQEGKARPQDLPYSASSRKYYGQLADARASLEGGSGAAPAGAMMPPYRLDYN